MNNSLQRKIGLKVDGLLVVLKSHATLLQVLEMGGNAVIGYRQSFDLEGDSGMVARGIGTVVLLAETKPLSVPPQHLRCARRFVTAETNLGRTSTPASSSQPISPARLSPALVRHIYSAPKLMWCSLIQSRNLLPPIHCHQPSHHSEWEERRLVVVRITNRLRCHS